VDEALRRDVALGGLVGRAIPVLEVQLLAAQHRGRDDLEMLGLVAARSEGEDADALAHFLGGVIARGQQGGEARLQRLDVRAQQPGLEGFQQVLHGEERLRLPRVEPESRQLVLRRGRLRLHEAIAARVAIPFDGRVVAALHVFQVALQRRERNLQLAHEIRRGHRAPLAEHVVDLVEALASVHSGEVHPAMLGARKLTS
jgi:hypothetical protein